MAQRFSISFLRMKDELGAKVILLFIYAIDIWNIFNIIRFLFAILSLKEN